MIRQIWKVRNTASDLPLKPPPATEETSAASTATQNDESQRETQNAPSDGHIHPSDHSAQQQSTEPAEKKRQALLNKTLHAHHQTSLSVCAYDPRSATVYALVEPAAASSGEGKASSGDALQEESKAGAPPTTKTPPAILQMPAALTMASSGLNDQSELGPTGSQPVGAPSQGVQRFSSLQDLQAQVAVHNPFAHAKTTTTSQAIESQNQAPQAGQASCLRFSPALSSANVVITNNGLTTFATQSVTASAIADNAVIGSVGFSEGVHYWEIICPIFCNSIDFGVTFNPGKITKLNTISEQFLSTTKRTVGVMLDLQLGQISFWLNSRMLKKNKTKELKKPGLTWYPYIRLQEPNIPAIINPFCRMPMADTLAPKFRKKLPQSLTNHSLSHSQISFLSNKLEDTFLVLNIRKEIPIEDFVKLHCPEATVSEALFFEPDQDEQSKRSLIFKIKDQKSKQVFVNEASKNELNVLDCLAIAKMLIQSASTSGPVVINTTVGYDTTTTAMVKKFITQNKEPMLKHLFPADGEFDKLMAQIGVEKTQSSQPEDSKMDTIVKNVEDAVKNSCSSQSQSKQDQSLSVYQVGYLKNTDRILVTSGAQAKVFAPDQTTSTVQNLTQFANYPKSQTDEVALNIAKVDFQTLLDKLLWSSINRNIATQFLEAARSTFNDNVIQISYFNAVQTVQSMLGAAFTVYQECEMTGFQVEIKDINYSADAPSPKKNQDNTKSVSFHDANLLVNILLDLEEQLWSMSQGPQVPQSVRDLWSKQVSRTYSAFTRLSSFAQYHDSEDPITLSELGLLNYEDEAKKIRHFMDYTVPIESIYENKADNGQRANLQIALQKQLPANYLLKGLRTWNVSLAQTINSLPPVIQHDMIPSSCNVEQSMAAIDSIKSLSSSNFVLTGSRASASLNVWTSTLGLSFAGGHNFKKQYYSHEEMDKVYIESLVKVMDQNGVSVLMNKNMTQTGALQTMASSIKNTASLSVETSSQPTAAQEAPKEKPPAQQPTTPNSDEDPFPNFELGALFDESQCQDVVFVESAESESDCDDEQLYNDFQTAWFKAKHIEETKVAPIKMTTENLKKDKAPKLGKHVASSPLAKNGANVSLSKEDLAKREKDMEKLLDELVLMGFDASKAKKAIDASTKTPPVLNDLIDSIIKDMTSGQPAEPKVQEKSQVTYTAYSCLVCTFNNATNPAATCQICGSPCPDSAVNDPSAKKGEPGIASASMGAQAESDRKNQSEKEAEEALAAKVIQDDLDQAKAEADQKQWEEEQEILRKISAEKAEKAFSDYYTKGDILEYFAATNKGGKSLKPIVAGAAMFNEETSMLDLHFINFKYRKSYMKAVTNGQSDQMAFELALGARQQAIECLYPTLIDQARFNPAKKALSRDTKMLRASNLGVARLELSSVDKIVQIGDNIEYDQPMLIVITGKDTTEAKAKKVTVLSVNLEGMIKIVDDHNLTEFVSDSDSTFVDQSDVSKTEKNVVNRLVTQKGTEVQVLKVSNAENNVNRVICEQERCVQLNQGETIVSVSNGLIFIENKDSGKARSIFVNTEDSQKTLETSTDQPAKDSTVSSGSELRIKEEQVLEMTIDPKNVSTEQLEKYENLMKGKIAKAVSNANYQSLGDQKSDYPLSSIHTWRNDAREQKDIVGSFEMKFEKPTSLVSLSMDITFACNDTDKLLKGLQSEGGVTSQAVTGEEESKAPTEVKTQQISTTAPETSEKKAQQALGIFSIKGFSEDAIKASKRADPFAANAASQGQQFMPLIVERNKQASYNSSYIASRMLVDNDKMFASNYPKPHITFAHMDGDQMTVQKVTVRVPQNTKTGVYPLGEGLVFLADTLQAFEIANIFRNFELQHYTAWKEQRIKDPRPLRSFEPVAFFQLDANQTITFDIDFQRPSKYILIMPTAFRKKPVKLSQNPDFVPMEIQFFGVVGHSHKQNALECVEINDQSQNLASSPTSDYDCEVKIIGTDETISVVKNFKIDQLRIMDHSISPETILSLPSPVASQIQYEGLSLIRVTDSNLQLQKIAGVSITLRSNKANTETDKPLWVFSNATIQGQEATVAKSVGAQADSIDNEHLFGNKLIPTSYYRSCLLSPRFFNVFNKPITRIVFDQQFDLKLRLRVMSFLKHMIKTDHDFCPLILKELQLQAFVEANIIGQSSQTIHQASEFLQAFQGEKEFAPTLYEILIEQVRKIPDVYLKANSYDAVIGMLKWALPLDYQRTLDVLAQSLYQRVTLEKVAKAQTPQLVEFRTRINQTTIFNKCYPFDDLPFTAGSESNTKNGTSAKEDDSSAKSKNLLTHLKYAAHQSQTGSQALKTLQKQTYSVEFFQGAQLEMVKLYFTQSTGLFSLAVSIEDKKDSALVFHKVYPPHTVAQFSDFAIYNPTESLKDYALTVSNLAHKCKHLTITLQFSGPLIEKHEAPTCFMEFYGKMQDESLLSKAIATHKGEINELPQKSKDAISSQGSSLKFYKNLVNQDTIYIPLFDEKLGAEYDQQSTLSSVEEPKKELIDTTDKSNSKPEATTAQSPEFTKLVKELKMSQEGLRQALLVCQPGDPQNLTLILGSTIQCCQNELVVFDMPVTPGPMQADKCTGYLVNHASDLTKLIKFIVSSGQLEQSTIRESLLRVHKTAHNAAEGNLSDLCLTLFKHYVAYESGIVVENMISFIKQCLIPLLTPAEHKSLYKEMISQFLSTPRREISQKSVIQAMSQLRVPAGDLIGYLGEALGMKDGQGQITDVKENPISILTAVFVLNMASIKSMTEAPIDALPVSAGADLTFDQLLKIVFKINIWICSNKKGYFTDVQKITLLKLAMSNLQLITKNATPQAFLDIMSDKQSVQTFLLELICLNDQELLEIYQQFLIPMLQRLEQTHKKVKAGQATISKELKQTFMDIVERSQEILQETFECLINSELGQLDVTAAKVDGVKKMLALCAKDKDMFIEWLRMLNVTYLGNVVSVNRLTELFNYQPEPITAVDKSKPQPEKGSLEANSEKAIKSPAAKTAQIITTDEPVADKPKDDAAVELNDVEICIPDSKGSQVPINMVKSLIKLLNKEKSQVVVVEKSSFEDESANDIVDGAYNSKQLQKLWSITLQALMQKTFQVQQMIDAGVLEEMISAFLDSSSDIKQATFVQILTISQTIAIKDKNGKSICNLLLMTLKNTDWTQDDPQNVTYLICQGWLDILIHGTFQDLPTTTTIYSDAAFTITCKLDQRDASELLVWASKFLTQCLNIGNFEGVSGAKQHIVLKLQIAYCMVLILNFAEDSSGSVALKKVLTDCQHSIHDQRMLETAMDNLLLWLFLSGRLNDEEAYLANLSNNSLQTSSTFTVKLITLNCQKSIKYSG